MTLEAPQAETGMPNIKIQRTGAIITSHRCRVFPAADLERQPISLNNHRLQHIQNRHHLPLRLPEESVPYAWIKAAESFEQLGEMGFELRADRQD